MAQTITSQIDWTAVSRTTQYQTNLLAAFWNKNDTSEDLVAYRQDARVMRNQLRYAGEHMVRKLSETGQGTEVLGLSAFQKVIVRDYIGYGVVASAIPAIKAAGAQWATVAVSSLAAGLMMHAGLTASLGIAGTNFYDDCRAFIRDSSRMISNAMGFIGSFWSWNSASGVENNIQPGDSLDAGAQSAATSMTTPARDGMNRVANVMMNTGSNAEDVVASVNNGNAMKRFMNNVANWFVGALRYQSTVEMTALSANIDNPV